MQKEIVEQRFEVSLNTVIIIVFRSFWGQIDWVSPRLYLKMKVLDTQKCLEDNK